MPTFGTTEHDITSLFPVGKSFDYDGHHYVVEKSGKPKPSRGECKTDTYVFAREETGNGREFKISIKQPNAEFLENKIRLERAKEIFGDDAQVIIRNALESIRTNFEEDKLVCVKSYRRTAAKTIKLGWKFELLKKDGGKKAGKIELTEGQKWNIYAGTNLSSDKKNCKVNNEIIPDSGVANMYLEAGPEDTTLKSVLSKLKPMDEFIRSAPSTVYFACKALNYRLEDGKWDGDRPLAVYVQWGEIDGKLDGKLVMDRPLEVKGNEVGEHVKQLVDGYGINKDNFDEIENYLSDTTTIYK